MYWGPGAWVTFLVGGAESGGACFIIEGMAPPGGGPPAHVHHFEEESLYILQGNITVQAAGQTFQALPGDFIHRWQPVCYADYPRPELRQMASELLPLPYFACSGYRRFPESRQRNLSNGKVFPPALLVNQNGNELFDRILEEAPVAPCLAGLA